MTIKIFYRSVFRAAVYMQPVGVTPVETNIFHREITYIAHLNRKTRGVTKCEISKSKVFYVAEQKARRNADH